MKRTSVCAAFLAICANPALAESAIDAQQSGGKFHLNGTTLYLDTDKAVGDQPKELVGDDVDKLLKLLTQNPDVETLVLNSGGGWVWAGNEMGRIVLDFELDTHVEGECSSSCVTVFLAGQSRTLARGSKIGFHQNFWSAEGMQSYYKRWYGDEDGWDTPFGFSSWLYNDVQTETYEQLNYMIERGVDARFAIETKRSEDDLWFPTRAELTDAGVLRD